ncbi:LuxR C-terminal-related transcriptional regulator [Reichenbachiella carrageenanivorans]|uniref:LuxR C-terminal-related transcriptional regulator n=1 Tax=Reichenbachiella carrageenanivorans TaxID=2979869 RepID=A0ABY6D141_9BACT|nr:LuxR C-terminal-related transcriptional regulator [Reichenbachiella carrageenanivorans]UXX79885.1 LuxR C-terminal-related transcriptional regulator [Reichenbachiella carrageenanivorans]
MTAKLWCLLFLFLVGWSQSYAQTIHYQKSEEPLLQIKKTSNQDWLSYTEPIYEGINNGVYWFKIEIPATSEAYVLHIPEAHITRAWLYQQDVEISRTEKTRFVHFRLLPTQKTTTYYLKVDCLLEARIPLQLLEEVEYYRSEQLEILGTGAYYGIVICILMINFFSYLNLSHKTYLYYIFMTICMSANAVYKDGSFALLFGAEGINEYIEPTINSILGISCIFCIESYLRISRDYPRLYRIGIGLVVLSQLLNIGVLLTHGSFWYYVTTELVVLLALDVFCLSGYLLWRKTKSLESGMFFLAYGIPLFVAHGYYLSPYFGLQFMNISFVWYKVGSVFEMAVFTYVIIYQSKRLSLKNHEMRQKIVDYTAQLSHFHENSNEKETHTLELIKRYRFTLKEIEILQDISGGSTNKDIANKHFISQNTVKYHIRNIFDKLNVNNRKEAGSKLVSISSEQTQGY